MDFINQLIDSSIRGMLFGVTIVFWGIGIKSICSFVANTVKKFYHWITSTVSNYKNWRWHNSHRLLTLEVN